MSQVESGETRGASGSWQVEECQLPLTCSKVIITIITVTKVIITIIGFHTKSISEQQS